MPTGQNDYVKYCIEWSLEFAQTYMYLIKKTILQAYTIILTLENDLEQEFLP